jgi:hypothetical protein
MVKSYHDIATTAAAAGSTSKLVAGFKAGKATPTAAAFRAAFRAIDPAVSGAEYALGFLAAAHRFGRRSQTESWAEDQMSAIDAERRYQPSWRGSNA